MNPPTKEQVSSAFTAGAAVNAGGSVTDSGVLDTQAFMKQKQSGGGAFNAQSAPLLNGKPKLFDEAADRGPAIGAHKGMTPTAGVK